MEVSHPLTRNTYVDNASLIQFTVFSFFATTYICAVGRIIAVCSCIARILILLFTFLKYLYLIFLGSYIFEQDSVIPTNEDKEILPRSLLTIFWISIK